MTNAAIVRSTVILHSAPEPTGAAQASYLNFPNFSKHAAQ